MLVIRFFTVLTMSNGKVDEIIIEIFASRITSKIEQWNRNSRAHTHAHTNIFELDKMYPRKGRGRNHQVILKRNRERKRKKNCIARNPCYEEKKSIALRKHLWNCAGWLLYIITFRNVARAGSGISVRAAVPVNRFTCVSHATVWE